MSIRAVPRNEAMDVANWEYTVLCAESTTLQGKLTEAGLDGWEATCLTRDVDGWCTVVCKKQR